MTGRGEEGSPPSPRKQQQAPSDKMLRKPADKVGYAPSGFSRLVASILPPRSRCARCGRPFFSNRRFRCPCGETARVMSRSATDAVVSDDRLS